MSLTKTGMAARFADIILPDSRSLNREMVRDLLAWWYRHQVPTESDLAKLEVEAKEPKRGLWSRPNTNPPRDWRRGEGAALTKEVVGSRNIRVFHPPTSPSIALMNEANNIVFKTATDAEAMGYRKTKDSR